MNNSQINNIEWKDGAVCFANGWQWFYDCAKIRLSNLHGCCLSYHNATLASDFQLNEIRQGDYIEASDLDTEQKYNDAVQVFGLFGFDRWGDRSFYEFKCEILLADSDGDLTGQDELCGECQREINYNQLMAIGKLKRLMNERNNTVLSLDEETELKSRSMASELNSQSNDDDWPCVGGNVIYHDVICKVLLCADKSGHIVILKNGNYCNPHKDVVQKPKTPEDLLIEELQTKLVKNNAVDNWMLAANIISGDIEGLTYTSKGGK